MEPHLILLRFALLPFTNIAPYEVAGAVAGSPAASRGRKPPTIAAPLLATEVELATGFPVLPLQPGVLA